MTAAKLIRIGPLLATAIALCLVGAFGIGDQSRVPPTKEYFTDIRSAVDKLPYSIDRWIGQDEDVTPSARELLRPNVIVQRRYVDPLSGDAFSLLIVHCGDMRDMQGHYPPVCYPAHGWKMLGKNPMRLTVGDTHYPVTEYLFSQDVGVSREEIALLNFFVLPNVENPVTPTMDLLRRSSQTAGTAALGSAQVQVLFSADSSHAYRQEVFEHIVKALEPMMREIASVPE